MTDVDDEIKFKIKSWNINIHVGSRYAMYGSVRDTSKDFPHYYTFSLMGAIPQYVSWGIVGEKHVPKYVKDAVYKRIVAIKGKQNVRKERY
jgi:hypothetical protein